eukprot:4458399-Lingulodinium_polyedra.AAC.1
MVISRQGKAWARYSLSEKQRPTAEAKRRAEEQREALMEQLEALRAERDVLAERAEAAKGELPDMVMSEASLEDRHWALFVSPLEDPVFKPEKRL